MAKLLCRSSRLKCDDVILIFKRAQQVVTRRIHGDVYVTENIHYILLCNVLMLTSYVKKRMENHTIVTKDYLLSLIVNQKKYFILFFRQEH